VSARAPSFSYTIGPAPRPTPRISTSPTEILHLVVAFSVLTLAFSLIELRFIIPRGTFAVLVLVGVAATASLTGFILHELAHKIVAQRRGFWAEFRVSPMGLVLSLFTAYLGFLFAAPGATMVGGMGDPAHWGKTSLAGPLVNFGGALLFLGTAFLAHGSVALLGAAPLLLILAYLNGWFGAFNLIPVGPLDGAKVFRWSKGIWAVSFGAGAGLAGLLFWLVNFRNPYF
jgi:Zn-dependent protease